MIFMAIKINFVIIQIIKFQQYEYFYNYEQLL